MTPLKMVFSKTVEDIRKMYESRFHFYFECGHAWKKSGGNNENVKSEVLSRGAVIVFFFWLLFLGFELRTLHLLEGCCNA
jgi:hypothetical protein